MKEEICKINVGGVAVQFALTSQAEFNYHKFIDGERNVLLDLLNEAQPNDVFIDVGANVGIYTCFLCEVLPSNHVIAIEPHPENIKRLMTNLNVNEFNAQVLEMALSNQKGEALFTLPSNKARHNQLKEGELSNTGNGSGETLSVQVAQGDKIFHSENLSSPTILKIDAQGEELNVLKGFKTTLQSEKCRLVYCEVHPDRNADLKEAVVEFLETKGFTTQELAPNRGHHPIIKARKL